MRGEECTNRIENEEFRIMKLFIWAGYISVSISLFLYSYTQVDLNLTLSQVSIWQTIQKSLQYIGYYERPLSTILYIGLVLVLFALYFFLLWLVKKKRIEHVDFWRLTSIVTLLLIFSYPAFSYDFFNYMFTAKTVLVYHKNPYEVIPLQFTGIEPWLTFMRWTHLPSAYTPLWILLTLPAYLFGFGYFLIIMWNVKILVGAFYLMSIWLIGKILKELEPGMKLLGMAIFAFNPLIIIETLISGHNDVVMMAFALVAMYLYITKKQLVSFFTLAVSVAAKLMTVFLIPLYVLKWNRYWALGLMLFGFLLVLTQREVLGWYWVWIVPFVALLPRRLDITILSAGVSLGLLLRYAPVLYFGHYNPPVRMIEGIVTIASVVGALLIILLLRLLNRTFYTYSAY